MTRVAVIGNAGAGKSTLARKLGQLLGLPVVHLDLILWKPGWGRASRQEFEARHAEAVARDAWIIDGWGSWETIEARLERADTVIFPDYPLPVLLWWATRRQVTSLFRPRPDFPEDCPQWPKTLELYGLIRALHRDARPRLLARLAELGPETHVVRLASPKEMRRFLAGLEAAAPNARVG